MQKVKELSIFFPFWNEEHNIKQVVTKASKIAEEMAENWEILMIDDGSTDKTKELAEKLAAENKNFRVISHTPNRGYGAALREGFRNARYELVAFNDGDGQFDFSEITFFLEKIQNADIVIGYRKKRHDHPFRHVLMMLLKVWDLLFFHFYFRDIDCGFKLFKKSALESIGSLRSEGAMISTEILAKAKVRGLTIAEVGVTHLPRKYGDQSGGNVFVIIRAMLESLILYQDIKSKRF